MTTFSPQVGALEILDTSETSLTIGAKVNVTNPTEYAATVPFIDINISVNDTVLGHATARNIIIVPGPNHNLAIEAVWDPLSHSGKKGRHIGSELLSQYISGLPASFPPGPPHSADSFISRLQHNPHAPYPSPFHSFPTPPRHHTLNLQRHNTHPTTQITSQPQPAYRSGPSFGSALHRRCCLPPHHLHRSPHSPLPITSHVAVHHLRLRYRFLQQYACRIYRV